MTSPKKWNDELTGANQALQENLDRSEHQIFASYGLIGAILAFGLIGYLLDRSTGRGPTFVVAGLIVGVLVGFYGLARTVWRTRR